MLERTATSAQLEESVGVDRNLLPPRAQRNGAEGHTWKRLAEVGNEGRSTDAEGDEDVQKNFCPRICTNRLDSGSFIDAMLSRRACEKFAFANSPRKHAHRQQTLPAPDARPPRMLSRYDCTRAMLEL